MSEPNPGRRYYRCSYAARLRLIDDDHVFKWVDEALYDEIETLASKMSSIEQVVEHEKVCFARNQMDLEKEICERVEDVLAEAKAEAKSSLKKLMIVVLLGLMIVFGLTKLIGYDV
ncbi:uncharacterized protein At4g04775-like [Capsella rubella]|nr:uncharacterized protein At4g04775-like [Capsella rubella]